MDWESIGDRLSIGGEKLGKSLKGMFGSRNARMVRTLGPLVKEINALESWAQGQSQEEMKAWVVEAMRQFEAEEKTLDDLLPETFALVREASVRTLGLRPYDVQLVGGIVLHRGMIAEMMTGEGKTLVATLPLVLNALCGKAVYLVTVNDYLARRDAAWMSPVYEYVGMTVGAIQSTMNPWERKPVYDCNIVYGTNNEFGFDYLRDNMKTSVEEQVQRVLQYAIVDEVDSILIDEARTPLIISGPAEEGTDKYKLADKVARDLVKDEHYEVKEKERSTSLLEEGIVRAQEMVGVESFYAPGFEEWPHFIENALRAHNIFERDKEYVVEVAVDERTGKHEREVIIVDEFTGRKMQGRRWSDGLHQAVETKEGLEPKRENQTLATITFQNYFRMFDKLAGMTGTAITEAGEFHKIYGLDVIQVPTNLPLARLDAHDVVYRTEKEKWNAIVEEIRRINEKGQPVLVGTGSIEASEKLAKLLRDAKIPHEVLNAKNHEREAHIVAMAGDRGSVTVATNMAGRGTDIKLGGNFEYRLNSALEEAGLEPGDLEHLSEIDKIRGAIKTTCDADEKEVLALGGLYVLGTERHEARRIDNQLRGRSGRQGNCGESRFYLSLQDDLMRIFYRDWVTNAMEKLGMTEGVPIESGMVTRAIAKAQKKVEERNFEIRKSLLEYDEVMDQQRKTIYGVRRDALENEGLQEKILEMIQSVVDRASEAYIQDEEGFSGWFLKTFGIEMDTATAEAAVAKDGNSEGVMKAVFEEYQRREGEVGDELMRRVEQYILLNTIDTKWKDHLHAVDALKAGIGLRGYGQVDPKMEYKKEGYGLFQKLLVSIEEEISALILRFRVQVRPPEGQAGDSPDGGAGDGTPALTPRGMVRGPGAGRTPARKRVVRRAPASAAFDVAKRRERAAEAAKARAAAAEEKAAAESAPEHAAAPEDASQDNPGEVPNEDPKGALPASDPSGQSDLEYAGVGRNDVCPCGSGKKFKKCHGKS